MAALLLRTAVLFTSLGIASTMVLEEFILLLFVGWFAVASAVFVGTKAALSAQFDPDEPAQFDDDESQQ
jgi:hypothetical protein